MKAKLIIASNPRDFEKQVNEFIQMCEILKVHYALATDPIANYYSALILYSERAEKK